VAVLILGKSYPL
jgi:acetate kinase